MVVVTPVYIIHIYFCHKIFNYRWGNSFTCFFYLIVLNQKSERLGDHLGEIVIVSLHKNPPDATSFHGVMTSLDSRGLLPRRWLFHCVWCFYKVQIHQKLPWEMLHVQSLKLRQRAVQPTNLIYVKLIRNKCLFSRATLLPILVHN